MSIFVRVDSEICQGHGRCFDACPEVFVPDVEGFSTVPGDQPVAAEQERAVRRAVQACPEYAISIIES